MCAGIVKNAEKKVTHKGTYEIPNLSEEYNAAEIDFSVALKEPKNDELKEFVRVEGTKLIRQQVALYISALKQDFAQDIILPTAQTTPLKEAVKAPAGVKAQPLLSEVKKLI